MTGATPSKHGFIGRVSTISTHCVHNHYCTFFLHFLVPVSPFASGLDPALAKIASSESGRDLVVGKSVRVEVEEQAAHHTTAGCHPAHSARPRHCSYSHHHHQSPRYTLPPAIESISSLSIWVSCQCGALQSYLILFSFLSLPGLFLPKTKLLFQPRWCYSSLIHLTARDTYPLCSLSVVVP